MLNLSKQKLLLIIVFCTILSISETLACTCSMRSDEGSIDAVKSAIQNSTMVFAGKVLGFEYRKGIPNAAMELLKKSSRKHIEYETLVVNFEVERWWKGESTKEVVLISNESKNSNGTRTRSSCDFRFKIGEGYLVYAYMDGKNLSTGICSRTSILNKTEDLRFLGEGKLPIKKKEVN